MWWVGPSIIGRGNLTVLKVVDEKCWSGHPSRLATFTSTGEKGTATGLGWYLATLAPWDVVAVYRSHCGRDVTWEVLRERQKALDERTKYTFCRVDLPLVLMRQRAELKHWTRMFATSLTPHT